MKRHYAIVVLIMFFWFVISFITNIMGPLIPAIIDKFNLQYLTLAAFIPVSFFLAYGIMSIPAGYMIERLNEKTVLLVGFTLPLIGSLIFALMPSFNVLLVSSFVIGLGMAMLQTVINPLVRVAGGEDNFAFFSVLGQLVFGLASFVSPLVYSGLVTDLTSGTPAVGFVGLLARVTPEDLPWTSLYWVFAVILIVTIAVVSFVRFPKITLQSDEKSGGTAAYKELFRKRVVYLYFFGMFAYVASEQGIANWMSEFLRTYHNVDPLGEGAATVGRFWGLMSIGCVFGLVALKLWDSKVVLRVSGISSIAALIVALLAPTQISLWAFPTVGFTISVMFSIIMSLGLNSVSEHHGSFAGILCSGIIGGAVGPLLVGSLGDLIGLRFAMMISMGATLTYILCIGFWAKPIIRNRTVKIAQLFSSRRTQ